MQSKPMLGMSRRACLPLITAAAAWPAMLVSASIQAAGQTKHEYKFNPANLTWREYRRDDLGFRVDMPGEPTIMTVETNKRSNETSADVMFDRVTFGVTVWENPEFRKLTSQQAYEKLERTARIMQLTYGGIRPELTRITLNSAPGLECIFEFMHYRTVVNEGRAIQVSVLSQHPDDDIKPAGQRFFQSFTLLPIP
jgi:hypothetical protein